MSFGPEALGGGGEDDVVDGVEDEVVSRDDGRNGPGEGCVVEGVEGGDGGEFDGAGAAEGGGAEGGFGGWVAG